MANPYINIYNNNPTEYAKDGTAVTTDGSYGNAVSVELDASQSESKVVKLAIRTVTGYYADNVTITSQVTGSGSQKWKYSLENDPETFTNSILLDDAVIDTNTIFYARATSSASETPGTDTSEKLKVTAKIYAE
jgi:hypothetical protein